MTVRIRRCHPGGAGAARTTWRARHLFLYWRAGRPTSAARPAHHRGRDMRSATTPSIIAMYFRCSVRRRCVARSRRRRRSIHSSLRGGAAFFSRARGLAQSLPAAVSDGSGSAAGELDPPRLRHRQCGYRTWCCAGSPATLRPGTSCCCMMAARPAPPDGTPVILAVLPEIVGGAGTARPALRHTV